MINYSKYLLFAFLVNAVSVYAADSDKENPSEKELSEDSFNNILKLLEKRLSNKQADMLFKRIRENCNVSLNSESESPPKKKPFQPISPNQNMLTLNPAPLGKEKSDSDEENSSPVDHSLELADREEENFNDKSIDLFDYSKEQEQPQPLDAPEINNLIDENNDEDNDENKNSGKPAPVAPTTSSSSYDASESEESFNVPTGATLLFSLGNHCAYVSPNPKGRKPPKGIIYIGNAVKDYQENRIALEDRLDLSGIFTKQISTKKNLFVALLKIETHLLGLIKENPKLVTSTVYVGQTKKTLRNRAAKHKRDFNNKGNMTKCKTVNLSLKSDFDVRLSWLTENTVDKKYLNIVEILVGDLFFAQALAGSAVLGDEKAYSLLKKYYAWPERKAALLEKDLYSLRENLGKILFENKVNAANLNTVSSNSLVARKLF